MLVLFALAVAGIVAAVDLVLLLAIGGRDAARAPWSALLALSALVLLVIGLGSLYRIATLRGGGAALARELGAMPIGEATDFTSRRLRNVVEEIAIAAGAPVPEIFVLEDEAGINAFASGYAPTDAAVTVTRGALDKLTRAELQGVIGHEFSHLLNGDMRLNIRLVGLAFGIIVIATIGRRIAAGAGRGRGRDSGSIVMFGLALFAVGWLGVLFARLIRAAIARQREFLADASAVQFTRDSGGIAGALKKIGALAEGSRLANGEREEVAHMLFGDGVGYSALFATHPPLTERILRLDPAFDVAELGVIEAAWSQPERVGKDERTDASIAGFAPRVRAGPATRTASAALPLPGARRSLDPDAVVAQVGESGDAGRALARDLRDSIPQRLREAAVQRSEAMPLLYALVLSGDSAVRERQLVRIAARFDEGTRALVGTLAAAAADLHPMQRLPLASLAFPALRRQPRTQLTTFMIVMRELIDADGRVDLGEYCLARLLGVQVVDALDPAATQAAGRVKLVDAADNLRDLLAVVADHGHDDRAAAARAYAMGVQEALPDSPAAYAPPAEWALALDRALPRLDQLLPAGKELVVRAVTRAISADGIVSVAESELLRTICASLHCPLPPGFHASRSVA